MRGVGALVGGVQCMLVPAACVSVLLAVQVNLRSRVSGGGDKVIITPINAPTPSMPD